LDDSPRGRYFEDFAVGETLVTNRRTITEADIVNFAGLSGDFNPLHTDEVYGQSTPFGGRIAHGMLVVSVGTGLVNQTGWFAGTTLALLEITRKFTGAVKPGDTVRVAMDVATAKESSKGQRGVITFNTRIVNQRDETVIEGQEVVMLRRRPQNGEA
jgi:acyl dehydratase